MSNDTLNKTKPPWALTSAAANSKGIMRMRNVQPFSPNCKKQSSAVFTRTLSCTIEWLEYEWGQQSLTLPEKAFFREAHRGLAGLRDLLENGVVAP